MVAKTEKQKKINNAKSKLVSNLPQIFAIYNFNEVKKIFSDSPVFINCISTYIGTGFGMQCFYQSATVSKKVMWKFVNIIKMWVILSVVWSLNKEKLNLIFETIMISLKVFYSFDANFIKIFRFIW